MMIRLLYWSVFVVGLMAFTTVFAQPNAAGVLEHVKQLPLVHDQTCNIQPLRLMDVSCNVWYDEKNDVRWYALYDAEEYLTHLFAVKGNQMAMIWQRRVGGAL